MSHIEALINYKSHANTLKYDIISDYQANIDESLNHNILLVNTASDGSNVKHILQTPPVEVITVLGLDTVNQENEIAIAKFMISSSVLNEVFTYKSLYEQEMLRSLNDSLNSRTSIDQATNILGEMSIQGLMIASIEIVKKNIQDINTARLRFRAEFTSELNYVFRCIYHTWKNDDISNIKKLGLNDFLDFCSKHSVLDSENSRRLYEMMISMNDISVGVFKSLYDMIVSSKRTDCIDIDHLIKVIFKAYKMYRSDNSVSNASMIVSLLNFLDVSTSKSDRELDMSEYDDEDVFGLIIITLEMFKYVSSSKDTMPGILSDINSMTYSLISKIIEGQEGILDSFLLSYIPYTILSVCKRTDGRFKNFKKIFMALSSYSRFFQYVASFATKEMRDVLNTAFGDKEKILKKMELKFNIYETLSDMDTENRYRDELSGCMIVIPAVIKLGEGDIWVDKYTFLSYLYEKPQNPYTREHLTPEEFRTYQKERESEIKEYIKERSDFLSKIVQDE